MLDGLDRLRRNGGVFTNERTQDEKQELTAVYGSPIEQFALDAITVTDNPEHVVHKDELYAAFTRHCDFIRADDTPSKRKLTRKLKESTGITDGKSTRVSADGNQVPVYKGLKLNEDYFTKIQVNELPSHSYEDNSGGDTRSTDSGQTTFDND